ncbi:hypothetical protein GCM10011385_18030 [Nitratireductor aestuarii]|uniref:Alkaline proteinase inhibitor/ Outer membrane lipoprotein Omp19 domain-containing protein n=1 Tax=Nitratireductor aestuarii TaxID=1735103 RepID=A0A916RQB6_9HYPH|nr:hypothetical protein [Nitratireductor aestuarii]GGA64640.1 hypothetical protein GCM10011385_18030 [Nitratireductor aestuarii]
MKLAYLAVAAALGAFGAGPALMTPDEAASNVDGRHTSAITAGASYQLKVVGLERGCAVTLRKEQSRLHIAPGCSSLSGQLADARFWQKDANGDLLFISDDGRTVAQFFPGDGVAYESVKPVTPIMMLDEL